MLLAICSDSHDNLANIDKFLQFCQDKSVAAIIHCGDWCAPAILKYFREKFSGDIYGVYGNVHADPEDMQRLAKENNIELKKGTLKITLDNFKIAINHFPDQAKDLAADNQFDYVFYGHNHKPWLEKINFCTLANPGTLAGLFQRASFATLNTQTQEIKLVIVDTLDSEVRG